MKRVVLFCIGCFISGLAVAQQEPVIRGRFVQDSVSIGEVVPYSLSVQYPRTWQVLFPDSSFSFKPFEIVRKKFFPTRTTGEMSYDSAVYFLTTFEIDSVQRLKLPLFVLQERDCVTRYSLPDSLFLNFRVASIPDSVSAEKLPLKVNTAYQGVEWLFNYPFFSIVGIILLVALIAGWIIFGKRIRKYFALRRLKKEYLEFVERFNRSLDRLAGEFSSRRAEETLVMWKGYMEGLENHPYTKFTSREIIRVAKDQHLDQALRSIDRGIYGGLSSSLEPFKFLQSYSLQRFQQKESEVKNG